jgi:tetratricopeptide (TPR) repeat protein
LERQETEARASVQSSPQDVRAQLALITLLRTAGRRYDALDAAREAHRLLPEEEPVQLALSELLISTARLDEAEALLEPAADRSAAHRARLASVQLRAGRRDEALKTLARLPDPTPVVALEVGQIYLDALRPELALPFLRRAALSMASPEAQAQLGLCLLRLAHYTEAAETLSRVVEQTPNAGSLHYYLGSATRLTDNRERLPVAAEHLRRAVELEPNEALHHYELGLCYVQLRDWPNAAEELAQAAERKPEVAEFQRDLARIQKRQGQPTAAAVAQSRYLRLLSDSPAAIALLEPLVRQSPQDLPLSLELGEAYYDSWRTPKTLELLHKLEERQPDNPDVITAVFRGERASKHDELALKALDRLLVLQPERPELLAERIVVLQRLNRYEEAEGLLTKLRDREPNNPARHYQLALALMKWSSATDRMAVAERSLREVIRLNPTDADGLYRLGLVLQNTQRPQEAIRFFRKALDLSPRMTDAVRALARAYAMTNDKARSDETFRLYNALNAQDEEQRRLEMPSSLHRARLIEHQQLADFYVRTGRFDSAVAELEGVIHATPGNIEIRRLLVSLYGHLHRFQRQYEERVLLTPPGSRATSKRTR